MASCGGTIFAGDIRADLPVLPGWLDTPNLSITTTSSSGGLGLFARFEGPEPFSLCFDDGYLGFGMVPIQLLSAGVE